MAITKRQKELDVMKWMRSIELGFDACGSFDFCVKCNKANENPCDKAYAEFNKKPAVKKSTAKKEVAVTATKKTVAKKTTAKKTASKK